MYQVGQKVISHWRKSGRSIHTVIAVHDNRISSVRHHCASGLLVQVSPALDQLTEKDWIDSGWFKPYHPTGDGPCVA